MAPEVGLTSWRMARATVDLPQPDSPTRASVWPRSTSNETLSTACTTSVDCLLKPRRMRKWTVRSSTASRLTATTSWCRAPSALDAAQKQDTQ